MRRWREQSIGNRVARPSCRAIAAEEISRFASGTRKTALASHASSEAARQVAQTLFPMLCYLTPSYAQNPHRAIANTGCSSPAVFEFADLPNDQCARPSHHEESDHKVADLVEVELGRDVPDAAVQPKRLAQN